jgi:branched-chain amino acid aminotransferase
MSDLPEHRRAGMDSSIPTTDPGWLWGATIFETIPLYGGRPYLFHEHWVRLVQSAERLSVPLRFTESELDSSIQALVQPEDAGRLLARVTVSVSGHWSLGLRRPRVTTGQYTQGWRVVLLPPWLNGRCGVWGTVKSGNLWSLQICQKILQERQADEGVFVTPAGEVLEGTITHVFLVKQGRILTPSLASGILPGVTRARVLSLARGRWDVSERPISVRDLWEADECFVTGSGAEVTPVREIEGRSLPSSCPGLVTSTLMSLYARDVRDKTARRDSRG